MAFGYPQKIPFDQYTTKMIPTSKRIIADQPLLSLPIAPGKVI
jgi:hypothetical protein